LPKNPESVILDVGGWLSAKMVKAILFDSRKCIGCGACSEGCKQEHHLSGEANPEDLGAETFTVVHELQGIFVRKFCRHCLSPACASSCPVGALRKLPDGPVVYDGRRCIGCRYCFVACPYSIPRYQWSSNHPLVRKCDFCAERLSRGEPTACAEVCPTGATLFGEREDLLVEARRRISSRPEHYFPHIFGEKDGGGSSVLMIAGQDLSRMGIRMPLTDRPLPALTAPAMVSVAPVGVLTAGILTGLWWSFKRREKVAAEEQERKNRRPG